MWQRKISAPWEIMDSRMQLHFRFSNSLTLTLSKPFHRHVSGLMLIRDAQYDETAYRYRTSREWISASFGGWQNYSGKTCQCICKRQMEYRPTATSGQCLRLAGNDSTNSQRQLTKAGTKFTIYLRTKLVDLGFPILSRFPHDLWIFLQLHFDQNQLPQCFTVFLQVFISRNSWFHHILQYASEIDLWTAKTFYTWATSRFGGSDLEVCPFPWNRGCQNVTWQPLRAEIPLRFISKVSRTQRSLQ